MVTFLLQETLHNHKIDDDALSPDESFDAHKALSHDPESHKTTERNEKSSLLKHWPLISSIIVYCIFSLHDMAYTEVPLLFLQHSSLFIWPNMLKNLEISFSHRSFHCGQTAPGNMEVWDTPLPMLVLFLQFQVCPYFFMLTSSILMKLLWTKQ